MVEVSEEGTGDNQTGCGEMLFVAWEEIEEAADSAFNIWLGQPEIRWAHLAWAEMGRAGLTSYGTGVERTIVLLRFIALSEVYWDFCACAWQEDPPMGSMELADVVEISAFRMGQLLGPEFLPDPESQEEEIFEYALREALDSSRTNVVQALLKGFGHATWLFISLWLSSNDKYAGVPWDALDPDVIDEVTNHNPYGAEAYAWVESGMPPYGPF